MSESSQAANYLNLFGSDPRRRLLGQRFSPVVLYLGAPCVMVAYDRHTNNGKAARERMDVALERSARAGGNVALRGLVSIEPDAPEKVCNRRGESLIRIG
ncbi:MAG: hypothetical protein ACRD36_06000 [Candidatus Acidiferrum sp.]